MAGDKRKIRLQGHEKFPLREGWLNKGMIVLQNRPRIFLEKDAPDTFGIGSNMVRSLRYWMKAFGLTKECGTDGTFLTETGQLLYKYDLCLEDMFTLWLLHSNIVKNVADATSWYMFFNRCNAPDLSKEQIYLILGKEITKYTNGQKFAENSLRNDVDVLLNMYSRLKETPDPEDKSVSPFVSLGLIKNSNGLYSKNTDPYATLGEWNILYELYKIMGDDKSVAIETLSEGDNSLAMIYQLSGIAINEYLDRLENLGYIHVDRTAGLDMVYKVREITPEKIIENYYTANR